MTNTNPYRKVIDHKIKGSVALPGQSSPLFNKTGEINASSKSDLLAQIGAALTAQHSATTMATPQELEARRQERRQVLVEAMNDTTGRSMQILGEALAAEIYETTNREGFSRRILQYREIGQGENNEVYLKDKDVIAFVATSPSTVMASEIRQRRLLPPEFHVNGYILIDTVELARTSSDLLEEKYEQGLEAIMVQEDRLWKIMADRAAIIRNTLQNFGTFTPSVFARIIEQVNLGVFLLLLVCLLPICGRILLQMEILQAYSIQLLSGSCSRKVILAVCTVSPFSLITSAKLT